MVRFRDENGAVQLSAAFYYNTKHVRTEYHLQYQPWRSPGDDLIETVPCI